MRLAKRDLRFSTQSARPCRESARLRITRIAASFIFSRNPREPVFAQLIFSGLEATGAWRSPRIRPRRRFISRVETRQAIQVAGSPCRNRAGIGTPPRRVQVTHRRARYKQLGWEGDLSDFRRHSFSGKNASSRTHEGRASPLPGYGGASSVVPSC